MAIFTIAQITRKCDVAEINHSVPGAIHHEALLQILSTVDLVDQVLVMDGRGRFAIREPLGPVAGDAVVWVVVVTAVLGPVGVAILAVDIIWSGNSRS